MKIIDQHIVQGLLPYQLIISNFQAVRIRRLFVFTDRKEFYFVQDVSTEYFANMFLKTPVAEFHLFMQSGFPLEACHPNQVLFN